MIKWHEEILIHNSIEDIEKLKFQIENKQKPTRVYCIIDALTENNLFEIVSAVELTNEQYKEYYSSEKNDIVIYAVAKSKNNIKQMLVRLIQNIINEDGMIDKNLLYTLGGD